MSKSFADRGAKAFGMGRKDKDPRPTKRLCLRLPVYGGPKRNALEAELSPEGSQLFGSALFIWTNNIEAPKRIVLLDSAPGL